MDNMDIMELIDMLYAMVSEAWGVPLGNDRCLIEREKALGVLEQLKGRIPTEVSEARRLVAARDEFIGNAKREAESMRRHAEESAQTMVEEQEIVRVARERALEIMTAAESKSTELRRVANEYIDEVLRHSENSMTKALAEVSAARSSFRTAAGSFISVDESEQPSGDAEYEENYE